MSKINQIQQALKEMDGGEFQKLVDAYLNEKGFGHINAIGSVIAANKVKPGTPDTLIALPNGNYIFAEHTTQSSDLLGKMKKDLAKCFDETKTGVPIRKIEQVVFCFTGKLNAKEQNELAEACQQKGVNLDLFGIDALSFDLYSKYPGLALDFLGIKIDTDQIVPPARFVALYNKSKLATPLDLGFHFREEELGLLLNTLEAEDLVFLSGRPGVGKSRLALEACRRFSEAHPEYEVACVLGRDQDLWEDLKTRFTKPGHFLIFVDDANQVSRFEYITDLLLHQREDQKIKVVATVRDYALTKVQEAARPLGMIPQIELRPFIDKQIKELITHEYKINNDDYLERIAEIAKGNPRLAVMAAEVAQEGPLRSIYDVSALYDRYFSSIQKDLLSAGEKDLGNSQLLLVVAIVSFFKAVDRNNVELMNTIEEVFGLSATSFWEDAELLHSMEVLDMYEDEVVRVADQVLSTYLFYLAVFEKRVLDFGKLLHYFFPTMRHRVIDSINPILSAFGTRRIIDAMRLHVERARRELEEASDEEGLLHLIEDFWFINRTDTLLWAKNFIDGLEVERLNITDIQFLKSSDTSSSPSILNVLRQFAFVDVDEVQMALDLLLDYLAKCPSKVPHILRVLIDDYGFNPNSYLREFKVQRMVTDTLWRSAERGDALCSRVFLAVASKYLGTHFEDHTMMNESTLRIIRFDLPITPELTALRETIWKRLFALYENEDLQSDVLKTIRRYSTTPIGVTVSEIVQADSKRVLPFLESVLDPGNYQHCTMMQDYLDFLDKHRVAVSENLRNKYRNDTFGLAEILLPKGGEQRRLKLSHEEYRQYKWNQLEAYTADYTLEPYVRLFERCCEIKQVLRTSQDTYRLESGVATILLQLVARAPVLYGRVLEHYLALGDPLQLQGYGLPLVQKLVEQHGGDEAGRLLTEPDYPTKRRWLFHLYQALPPTSLNKESLADLYKLYEEAECEELPDTMDYLLKYLPLDPLVVSKVVSILLNKAEQDSNVVSNLAMLFTPYTEVAKHLSELFQEDLDLLQRAYLRTENTQPSIDYDAAIFNLLLDLDATFITQYITWKYNRAERGWLSYHDDQRNYTFIWARSDYQEIMDRVVECVYGHEPDPIAPYLTVYFGTHQEGNEKGGKTRERQEAYLLRLIDNRSEDTDFMTHLFGVIAQLEPDRRLQFIQRFVQRNEKFPAFKRLPLEPPFWNWTGSRVPVIQRQIAYLESLLPLLNTVRFLPHKQYVEQRISRLRADIEWEKKRDFMHD